MWNKAASAAFLVLAACRAQPSEPQFPAAHRDVAPTVSDTFSTEDARDRLGEAEQVMDLAGIKAGMSVADVGAGEGYYTVRLARVVGPKGRVLAEDIVPEVRDQLSDRVQRERLDNVAVKLGTADNPMLPAGFIRPLVPGAHVSRGAVALRLPVAPARRREARTAWSFVVESNRPVRQHGMPPACSNASLQRSGCNPSKARCWRAGRII